MAKINSMAIWSEIANNKSISARKGFLGLSTKWLYTLTGSQLTGTQHKYSPTDGRAIEQALNSPTGDVVANLNRLGHLKQDGIGNYMLEAVSSADKQFMAVRLYQYQKLIYHPVSPLCIFEGHDAETAYSIL